VTAGRQPRAAPWDVLEAEYLSSATQYRELPAPAGPEVAFAGRSNVGKSSLMNALMTRKNLVRTSSTPGCTRKISVFRARARDGAVFHFVDLPGYGYAQRSKAERGAWGELIEAYLLQRSALRAVVVLCDARRGIEEEERQLVEFLASRAEPRPAVILVATKIDKLQKSKRRAAVDALRAVPGPHRILAVSATEGEGVPELWSAIRRAVAP
jgi:GTP-binding protein